MNQIFTGATAIDNLRVVLAIVDYRRPNLTRFPSYEFLGFLAGMDPDQVKQRVEDLESRGLLKAAGEDDAVFIELRGLLKRIVELTEEDDDEKDRPKDGMSQEGADDVMF